MPLGSVLELSEAGILQPIIGHPTDYNRKHFEPLLRLKPPSVWARGLGLLRALGMEEKLEEATKVLPAAQIARLPWVRRHWREHFPSRTQEDISKAIIREVQTLYADLWIFGDAPVARGLAEVKDPDRVARRLRLINEVRTYPKLFGLGGTAYYSQDAIATEPLLLEEIPRPSNVLPPELEGVAKGLGIDLGRMNVKEIVDFHASELGSTVRAALSSFERTIEATSPTTFSRHDLQLRIDGLREALLEAKEIFSDPRKVRAMDKTAGRVQGLLRLGGLAIGALVGSTLGASWLMMIAPATLGERVVSQLLPASLRDSMVQKAIGRQFSPGIAHLWQVRSKTK
jgi:hypothetical protein